MQVIVTGGASKMPRIQQAIKDALPNSELLSSIPPDEVIAVGCSGQASIVGEPWDAPSEHMRVTVQALSKDISVKVKLLLLHPLSSFHFLSFSVETKTKVRA